MLIDTHCHINMMMKKEFDTPIVSNQFSHAERIMKEAAVQHVTKIINVGTSVIESKNCVQLATVFESMFASIGIHPNDCTAHWHDDIKQLYVLMEQKGAEKVVAIGEIGFDKHYPGYDIMRQKDAFRAQVELALKYNLPLIIHTRKAAEETLYGLEEYKKESGLRGVIHCFSEDASFVKEISQYNFVLGIGNTLTYPANDHLREIFKAIDLNYVVLESDAPFLPPQTLRGKENHPKYVFHVADFLATLRNQTIEDISHQTTKTAERMFNFSTI
jgi:TatD DNase family protein